MQLVIRNLIDSESGETNLFVLKAMTRRRAFAEYGDLSPYALRQSLKYYGDIIAALSAEWRQAHGLPIATTMVSAFGKHVEGTRWSAF